MMNWLETFTIMQRIIPAGFQFYHKAVGVYMERPSTFVDTHLKLESKWRKLQTVEIAMHVTIHNPIREHFCQMIVKWWRHKCHDLIESRISISTARLHISLICHSFYSFSGKDNHDLERVMCLLKRLKRTQLPPKELVFVWVFMDFQLSSLACRQGKTRETLFWHLLSFPGC